MTSKEGDFDVTNPMNAEDPDVVELLQVKSRITLPLFKNGVEASRASLDTTSKAVSVLKDLDVRLAVDGGAGSLVKDKGLQAPATVPVCSLAGSAWCTDAFVC